MGKILPRELKKKYNDKIINYKYQRVEFDKFNYNTLKYIWSEKQRGYKKSKSFNDCWIMVDTETSKKEDAPIDSPWENHICAWTISIRAYHHNIVTLYGHKPSDCINTIARIHDSMRGDISYFYIHNLPYDWQFLRKFFFKKFGFPEAQLNVKSHYMINIQFDNGIILKDSLILAQVKLEKWANDLDVEHKKAIGFWDYNKVRNQNYKFNDDELIYIENDTLAGVECLDKMGIQLNKSPYSIPYTATGIVRSDLREIAKSNHGKDIYNRCKLSYEDYIIMEFIFHGGYCHANRSIVGYIMDYAECYDFRSSYPFVMLSEKFPMSGFSPLSDCSIDKILSNSDRYAFIFKLTLINVRLKNPKYPMPYLQKSKCISAFNPMSDNGRIMRADLIEIYMNEIDLSIINEIYEWDRHICTEVKCAAKGYLPRYFTDYIFELFKKKCELLAAGDTGINYVLAKGRLNSCYGMAVQKYVRDQIKEDYISGKFDSEDQDDESVYYKYSKSFNTILPYQWGCWVTSLSARNLYNLSKCIAGDINYNWLYSDTDSIYAYKWDCSKVYQYNYECKMKLKNNNYGAVVIDNNEFWLGVATSGPDDIYSEFKTLGSKRYCGRKKKTGELKITVSGVPKKGVESLNNDINNFKEGFIFDGTTSGKLCRNYFYIDDIYIDQWGNECGDSIDLRECDYTLDSILNPENTLSNYDTIMTYHINDKDLI